MLLHSEFFTFVNERESIRRKKAAGASFPWTEDQILQKFKFTNVHRHHDKTSMVLREKFYTPNFTADKKEILMNCALFRYFGTYEFADAVGWQEYDSFDFEGIKETARERLEDKERVFTGAYVITNQGISAPKQDVVVDYFLKGLYEKAEMICDLANKFQSWHQTATEMRKLNGFGGSGFMTKEVLLDTTYTGFWNEDVRYDGMSFPVDWEEWTPIGPGARRGIARILGDDSGGQVKEDDAFNGIMRLYRLQGEYYKFHDDDHLSPTDIQFQLCEFDKYRRVLLGQGRPRSIYRAPM